MGKKSKKSKRPRVSSDLSSSAQEDSMFNSIADSVTMNDPDSVAPIIEPGAHTVGSTAAPSIPGVCEEAFWAFLHENTTALMEVIANTGEWKDLVEANNEQTLTIQEMRQENMELRKRLAITEGMLTRAERSLKNLEDKMVETTTRSMRDNILLKNMSEEEGEDEDTIERKTLTFLRDKLKISEEDMVKIQVERAHRVGKKNRQKTRNIVVKFNSRGKTLVMKHLRNLERSSPIKISDQLPPEVHAKRNKLWPVFISAKQQGQTARWKQDQLEIDGRIKKPPTDTNMDINMDTTEVALNLQVKHTPVLTKDKSHFQAHSVKITSPDEVVPAIKALCADTTIAGATHLMYAYRVGTENRCIHNFEDDGEWGGARHIMDAIQKKNVYNHLICITRWYGGQHIGPVRFDIIKDLADQAIQGTG